MALTIHQHIRSLIVPNNSIARRQVKETNVLSTSPKSKLDTITSRFCNVLSAALPIQAAGVDTALQAVTISKTLNGNSLEYCSVDEFNLRRNQGKTP